MSNKRFDGFHVQLIEEDNGEWVAHFTQNPPCVSAIGDTPEEALRELKIAWEAMKSSYKAHCQKIPEVKNGI